MKQRYTIMSAHKEMRGFEYLVYSALSLSLLIVLVLLPLAPVFADEISPENTDVGVNTDAVQEAQMSETLDPAMSEGVPQDLDPVLTEATADDILDAPITEASTPEVIEGAVAHDGINVSEVTEESVVETESISEEELVSERESVRTEEASTSDEVSQTEEINDVEEVVVSEDIEESMPNADEVTIPSESVIEATTTTPETDVVYAVSNDENKFSFSKDECTLVGDGTFYCATATSSPEVLHTDRIFSAIDAEGDKEIYVEKGGELSAISDNSVDDDAPYFDEVSNTAVWHRLIDGRYQIVQFDFDSGEEELLTTDRYNNMQPNVFGDAVVWQGWVGNDWEIFLEMNGERTMLTDNTTHDIAPSANGSHIVWQSFEGSAWRMKVYDIRTGSIHTIEDAEGGSIENPRFVLVYDTKFESGDIETRGYDLKSGEVVHLASEPTSVPEEIPDPEQTGEERALVAPSTQPKQKTDSDENDDVGTTTLSGTDDGDLVIPALDVPLDEVVVDTTPQSSEAETTDVVIPSFETGTSTSETSHIEDVVVEPYVEYEGAVEESIQN
jgi:hypothetical protein